MQRLLNAAFDRAVEQLVIHEHNATCLAVVMQAALRPIVSTCEKRKFNMPGLVSHIENQSSIAQPINAKQVV